MRLRKLLISKVNNFEGLCKPVWINNNQVCHKFDGGITGFFRLVKKKYGFYWKTGEEFHGILINGYVYSSIIEGYHDGF